MARKRYLKPGFFKNEDLAELPFEYRLLFEGLWCWSDRDGRLEDRPRFLKAEIFPYDEVDVNAGLDMLQDKGFIVRYDTQVKGKSIKAIQILTFEDHQDVHKNEQSSIIPAQAPSLVVASTVQATTIDGSCTPCNLVLDTSNLSLVDDDVDAREIEIDEAVEDFCFPKQLQEEKEKNLAPKKEKPPLPTADEIVEKIEQSGTCHWWNTIQFYLAKGVKWDKINDVEKQIYYDQRLELFKKFYASKADNYRIRLPSCNEIAQNFYNWTPTELNREKLQVLNNISINRAAKLGNNQPSKLDDAKRRTQDFVSDYLDNGQPNS